MTVEFAGRRLAVQRTGIPLAVAGWNNGQQNEYKPEDGAHNDHVTASLYALDCGLLAWPFSLTSGRSDIMTALNLLLRVLESWQKYHSRQETRRTRRQRVANLA